MISGKLIFQSIKLAFKIHIALILYFIELYSSSPKFRHSIILLRTYLQNDIWQINFSINKISF